MESSGDCLLIVQNVLVVLVTNSVVLLDAVTGMVSLDRSRPLLAPASAACRHLRAVGDAFACILICVVMM